MRKRTMRDRTFQLAATNISKYNLMKVFRMVLDLNKSE